MKYDHAWLERTVLDDGTPVRLRLLRPEDRDELLRAFDRLSDASRYKRFLTDMPRLNRATLDYLTDVDQVDHVAIAVAHDETGDGLAIGRFVRLDDPTVAEPAVAVADAYQGHGLGTLLMLRLCQAARERGVEWFHVEFLESNQAVMGMLSDISDQLEVTLEEDGVYRGEFPIPELPDPPVWMDLLAEAARGLRVVERRLKLKAQRS